MQVLYQVFVVYSEDEAGEKDTSPLSENRTKLVFAGALCIHKTQGTLLIFTGDSFKMCGHNPRRAYKLDTECHRSRELIILYFARH